MLADELDYVVGVDTHRDEHVLARGETVVECSRTPQGERRLQGKDDRLDAVRTARATLASQTLTLPRSGQRQEALRLLLLARGSAVDVRCEALVQLRTVIVTAPDRLREELRTLPVGALIERCSRFRRSTSLPATRSQHGSYCAASPAASRPPPARPPSSSTTCSGTCAPLHHDCSTSPASARSSPRK
jgi:hypothetical protein